MSRAGLLALAASLALAPLAQAQVTFQEVNPTSSTNSDPDGASGGRTNGLATTPGNNQVLYAATEWGGIYKTTDRGANWTRLDRHRPTATWDVEVDPSNASRVYATSFYDGRASTQSGINVSTDGGTNWSRPASVTPPTSFCNTTADRTEFSAFGIAIDPATPATAYVGTACGLAKTTNSGGTWTYIDPTPGTFATRVWDVVVHHGGIVDLCGDDGHLRSTDGGGTWIQGTGISAGRCSIAASPDESYVLLAVVGTTIFETTNADSAGGATWTATRTNPSPQGRIPFVATNQRSDSGGNIFDLWFGDVSLHRVTCTTPASPASGGAARCGTGNSPAWSGPYTRSVGGHDDMGDIAFDSQAANDACPVLMSSDGGVYRNTLTTSPGCHAPSWNQPSVTPRALWPFGMSGADQSGTTAEDLYFGNQDNGVFGATNAGAAPPTWTNKICCDGFDAAAEPDGVVYSVCCFGGGGRSTQFFRTGSGFTGGGQLNTYPASGLPATFQFPDVVARWATNSYAFLTRDCTVGSGGCPGADGGLFVTTNILGAPIVWTELGNATEPASNDFCGVQTSVSAGTPTFFVQKGGCNATGISDQVWKFVGTNPAGTWTQLAALPNGGGFGIFAADPSNPSRLFASGQTAATANMYRSTDGGTTWQPLTQLDGLMGSATFPMRNSRGPTNFTGFNGYWQPSLIAVDPNDSNLVVAGGQDSGIFLSFDGGSTFTLVSDPVDGTGATPHIPRPRHAYFDAEPGQARRIYISRQGRGIWRLTPSGNTISVGDASITEGDSGAANASFTVTLSQTSASPVTVAYATADGTATTPEDYVATSGTLTIAAGNTTGTILVPVNGDTVPEVTETFLVNLSSPVGTSIADGQGVGTISDNDPFPSFSIGDAAVIEGDTGTRNLTFTVSLAPTSGQELTVAYATANGTATGNQASVANASPITINASGSASPYPATVSVPALGGTITKVTARLLGFSHTFPRDTDVLLVGPTGAKVVLMSDVGGGNTVSGVDLTFDDAGGALGTGLLTSGTYQPTNLEDNEPTGDTWGAPAPAPPYSSTLAAFNGTSPVGTWSLYAVDDTAGDSGSIAGGFSLSITTSAGDYQGTSGVLTFTAGSSSRTIQVAVVGDLVAEPHETVLVNLSNPAPGSAIGDGQGVGTIRDDEPKSADFGGDGKSDVVVYRAGAWLFFDYLTGAALSGQFTGDPASCIPAPGDFDGNGSLEFAQLCGDKWYFYGPTGSLTKTITTGGSGSDRPVPADYDGDGDDDVVVYRTGAWLTFDYASGASTGGTFTGHPPHFTGGTPVPYPADFDGDGKADFSIYAGGPWHFYNQDGSYKKGIWTGSIAGDIPVAGDYDGDGVDDVVVWRAGAWLWFDYTTGNYSAANSVFTGAPPHQTGGVPTPSPIDVDGDGKLNRAVYSGGPWHFYQANGSYDRGVFCGSVAGDRPISRRPLP